MENIPHALFVARELAAAGNKRERRKEASWKRVIARIATLSVGPSSRSRPTRFSMQHRHRDPSSPFHKSISRCVAWNRERARDLRGRTLFQPGRIENRSIREANRCLVDLKSRRTSSAECFRASDTWPTSMAYQFHRMKTRGRETVADRQKNHPALFSIDRHSRHTQSGNACKSAAGLRENRRIPTIDGRDRRDRST